MTMSDEDLLLGTARLASSNRRSPRPRRAPGLDTETLIAQLESQEACDLDAVFDALTSLRSSTVCVQGAYTIGVRLFEALSQRSESEDLQAIQLQAAFACWDLARRDEPATEVERWARQVDRAVDQDSIARARVCDFVSGRASPELIMVLCESPPELLVSARRLLPRIESRPVEGRLAASAARDYLREQLSTVATELDLFLLAGFELLVGTACRQLSKREEARACFDRAEANYRQTVNAEVNLSRLSYQRLALRLEERQTQTVLDLAPDLILTFAKLEMREDELKARFLQGIAFTESDRLQDAIEEFTSIVSAAIEMGLERLTAQAYGNLTTAYGLVGDSENAIRCSQLAIQQLDRLEDRFAIGKVAWGLANLYRKCGEVDRAIQTYRSAQMEFARIGLKADVAALNLVVADLQLESGDEAGAMKSVLSALPVLAELKMVPEGMAAVTLLQESARRLQIDRSALRELHAYFDEMYRR